MLLNFADIHNLPETSQQDRRCTVGVLTELPDKDVIPCRDRASQPDPTRTKLTANSLMNGIPGLPWRT